MQNKEQTNIQAFPQNWEKDGTTENWENGMNLLDYHASKFMQIYLNQHLTMLHSGGVGFTVPDMVESSYLIAREMIKQREL